MWLYEREAENFARHCLLHRLGSDGFLASQMTFEWGQDRPVVDSGVASLTR